MDNFSHSLSQFFSLQNQSLTMKCGRGFETISFSEYLFGAQKRVDVHSIFFPSKMGRALNLEEFSSYNPTVAQKWASLWLVSLSLSLIINWAIQFAFHSVHIFGFQRGGA